MAYHTFDSEIKELISSVRQDYYRQQNHLQNNMTF